MCQVEIPGAKGKPAVIVNKDDGIDKVNLSREISLIVHVRIL